MGIRKGDGKRLRRLDEKTSLCSLLLLLLTASQPHNAVAIEGEAETLHLTNQNSRLGRENISGNTFVREENKMIRGGKSKNMNRSYDRRRDTLRSNPRERELNEASCEADAVERTSNTDNCKATDFSDPIKIVEKNGENVTFTVSQVWSDKSNCDNKFLNHIDWVLTNFTDANGNQHCEKRSHVECDETYSVTAPCTNGMAVVSIFANDYIYLGQKDGTKLQPECPPHGVPNCSPKKWCHFEYKLKCNPCTDPPTRKPTSSPTKKPTKAPTKKPTKAPTEEPTKAPSKEPSRVPTSMPSFEADAQGAGVDSSSRPPYLTLHCVIALQGIFPSRSRRGMEANFSAPDKEYHDRLLQTSGVFIGEIQWVGFNFNPRGWASCNGQLLPIAQHTALFSILGTTYGGDGRTTFGLPNLQSRTIVHPGRGAGLSKRVLGETSGSDVFGFKMHHLPMHSHTYGDLPKQTSTATGQSNPHSHSLMPPFQGVQCIIALIGMYPSRTRRELESSPNEEGSSKHRLLGGADPFIGEITWFAGHFAPRGWALCDGQLLSVNSNDALFSLLGTYYGGDGRTTFGLPDARGRTIIHQGQGPGLSNRPLGAMGGTETEKLSVQNLPTHNHPDSGTQVDPTGSGQPFPRMPPYIALNCVIALSGIFPSRNRRDLQGASEPVLGGMIFVAFNFPPRGWAQCDGQTLPINQNQALFSLLGTMYGGDGRTTFQLPELRGRSPNHFGSGLTQGEKSGEESHTVSEEEMPQHSHYGH